MRGKKGVILLSAVMLLVPDVRAAPITNSRPLTSEQVAFLGGKSAIPDRDLMADFAMNYANRPTLLAYSPVGTKFRYLYQGTIWSDDVCRPFFRSLRKGGKLRVGMCEVPVPDHEFSQLSWRDIEPAAHLKILRRMYVSRQASAADIYRGPKGDEYWRKMAPVIRQLLLEGRVVMQVANVTLPGAQRSVSLYGVAYLPANRCQPRNGGQPHAFSALFADSEDPVSRQFNAGGSAGMPFLFRKELYLTYGSGHLNAVSSVNDGRGGQKLIESMMCEFDIDR